jgi:hypothetical protein
MVFLLSPARASMRLPRAIASACIGKIAHPFSLSRGSVRRSHPPRSTEVCGAAQVSHPELPFGSGRLIPLDFLIKLCQRHGNVNHWRAVQTQSKQSDISQCQRVLAYLCAHCGADQRCEVAAVELERELALSAQTVRACLIRLVELGAVQADLFPLNVWASPTGEAPELLARWEQAAPETEGDG